MEIVGNISVNDYQKLHIAVGWKMIDDKQIEIALKHSMFISYFEIEHNTKIWFALNIFHVFSLCKIRKIWLDFVRR